MVLRSISPRGVVLRDQGGNHYLVPAYGEIEVQDSLLNDTTFVRFLRARQRDLITITAKMPDIIDTTAFASLTPFHADEVFLEVVEGVRWHLVYNANSGSTYKWEYVGGPPLRYEINTSEAIGSSGTWANLDTDGPLITAPREGDYDAALSLVIEQSTDDSDAQATVQEGNEDGVAPFIWGQIDEPDLNAKTVMISGRVSKRLLAVTEAADIKARYYSSTAGNLPSFSNRVLEVTPVRII